MKRRAVDPADYEPLGPLQHRQQQSSEPLPVQSGRPQQAPPEHALPGQASRQNLHQQPNINPSQQQNGASNHHQQRGGPVHGRRQPQTSCDSCRRRKLKCDRRQPCSSCVARGLLCHGQPNAAARNIGQSPESSLTADAILQRLRALEDIVFRGHQARRDSRDHGDNGDHPQDGDRLDRRIIQRDQASQPSITADTPPVVLSSTEATTVETTWSGRTAETTATVGPEELEFGHTATMPLGRIRDFKVSVARHRVGCPLAFLGTSVLELGVVWMMPRAAAVGLLQDYLDQIYPIHPIIHGPTTQELLGAFYDRLARQDRLEPYTVAFILALVAVGAYFWQPDNERQNYFASAKEAAQASFVWREWASDILVNAAQEPGTCTLEGVQAWALLCFLIQISEGACQRFRFLHNCTLTAARELSFHLVDGPTRADPTNRATDESHVTRELKRRIWWYIASTDWLLGFTGGPNEGTYSVQVRQMNVRYPKNVNDDELAMLDDSVDPPLHRFTQMSYFLQRIRLGEIIRTVLDASSSEEADLAISDYYSKLLALDRLIEQALSDLPPFFQPQVCSPPRVPDMLELQSVLVRLGLLSRRSRLHRRFLLKEHGRHDGSSFYKRSRDICIESSRAVVSLAIDIIQRSLYADETSARTAAMTTTATTPGTPTSTTSIGDTGLNKTPSLSVQRLSLVCCNLSASCTVLAIYASGASSNKESGLEHGEEDEDDQLSRAAVSQELAQACRVLGALGTESPVPPDSLRNLVGLLNCYRIPLTHQRAAPTDNGKTGGESGNGAGKVRAQCIGEGGEQQQQKQLPPQCNYQRQYYQPQQEQQQQQRVVSSSWTSADEINDGGQFPLPAADEAPQSGLPVDLGGDDGGASPPAILDGSWDPLTMGSGEDYNHLFANLDYWGIT